MKVLPLLLALSLAQETFSIHLETCECQEIRELVNATVQGVVENKLRPVQEAIAGLENKLHLVNSSVQEAVENKLHLVNSSVQEAVVGLENKLHQVNSSVQEAVVGLENKLHQVNSSVQEAVVGLENKLYQVNSSVQEAVVGLENKLHQVNSSVQEAVASLENKLRLVNSSVQKVVAGLGNKMNDLICSPINSTENKALDTLEVKLITTMENLIQPIQYQLNYHLPLPISCKDLYEKLPYALSGYYWISQSRGPAVRVYCSMNGTCDGETGGWMRVADIDMRDTNQSCPSGLTLVSSPKRSCKPTVYHQCVSNSLSTQGIQYSNVCGKIIGYQENFPVAFYNHDRSIDRDYVNGISLTHGQSPRKHIWTFAGAKDETTYRGRYKCPCMSSAAIVPSYVGNDYFCDTAYHSGRLNTANPLWDGKGCTTDTCCSFNSPPWFDKELPSPTTDNIEMRVCLPYSDGNTLIEIVELYVQ